MPGDRPTQGSDGLAAVIGELPCKLVRALQQNAPVSGPGRVQKLEFARPLDVVKNDLHAGQPPGKFCQLFAGQVEPFRHQGVERTCNRGLDNQPQRPRALVSPDSPPAPGGDRSGWCGAHA